jgi:hypothetical protein
MRKLVLIILIVAIAVMFTACQKPQEQPTFEQRVIEDACKELNVDAQGATLTLVLSEYVPWLDCECYNYILTLADGTQWLVGARENADGFSCDVEGEI